MRPDALLLLLSMLQPSARDLVRAALDSLGGETRARSIASVRIDGAGYAGVDALTTFSFTETRDNRTPQLVQDVTVILRPDYAQRSLRTLRTGDRGMDTWFTEAPENVLLAALDAPDLASEGDTTVQFKWQDRPVRVHLKPTLAVELNGATTTWTHWQAGYPRQWAVTRNGKTVEAFSVSRVTIR
jgi:hypothetical protein